MDIQGTCLEVIFRIERVWNPKKNRNKREEKRTGAKSIRRKGNK